MSDLPAPLVPADVTMTGNDWFPWYFGRLRKSRWWRRASDLARARNVMLWGEAYASVPAGSLPDDDDELAEGAGFGMDVDAFLAVKAEIMGPWVLCSDGRWYHPTVCELALDAWNRLGEGRKAEATRKAEYRKRVREGAHVPRKKAGVPQDNPPCPTGQPTVSHGTEPECPVQMTVVPVGLGQQTDRQTLEAKASVGSGEPIPTKPEPWKNDADFRRLWDGATVEARGRSSQAKTWEALKRPARIAGGRGVIADCYALYLIEDKDVQRTGGPALHRWLNDGRWEHYLPKAGDVSAMTEADWQTAVRLWRSSGDWLPRFGPKPGEPGCRVPTHLILAEASAVAAGVVA